MTCRHSRPTWQGRRSLDAKFRATSTAWNDVVFACGASPVCVALPQRCLGRDLDLLAGGRRTGISSQDAGLRRSGSTESTGRARWLNSASRGRGAGATGAKTRNARRSPRAALDGQTGRTTLTEQEGATGATGEQPSEEATAIGSGGAGARSERPARHRKAAPRSPGAPPSLLCATTASREASEESCTASCRSCSERDMGRAKTRTRKTAAGGHGQAPREPHGSGKQARAAQAEPGKPHGGRDPKGPRPRPDVRIQSGEGREEPSRICRAPRFQVSNVMLECSLKVTPFSSQRRVRVVSDAVTLFCTSLWSVFAAVSTAVDCSPFSRSATCLMRALQQANVVATLSSRLRVAFDT